MIGLTGSEIKKIFKHRLILALLLLCTLFMAVMMLKEESFESFSSMRRDAVSYEQYLEATADMNPDEAMEWLKAESDRERKIFRETKNNKEYVIKSAILSRMRDRYRYLDSYNGYVQTVIKQAQAVQKLDFYADDAFARSDAALVEKNYARLTDVEVKRDAALFVEAVTGFDTADYILLFQLLLVAILIFGCEDENIKRLLRVQNKGRHHVFLAKAVALMCVSAVLVLFTYEYLMLVGFVYFGEGALQVPLQSLGAFEGSRYKISVGEFLLLFAVFKVLAAWVFAFLFSLCVIVAGNVAGSTLSMAVTAVFYAAYLMIDGRELMSPLKYVNPAAWFDVHGWMSVYANINLFTKAVYFEAGFAVGGTVLFAVLVVLSLRAYVSEGGRRRCALLGRIQNFSAGLASKIIERTEIAFHEVYRLFAEGGRWLVTAAFVVVYVMIINGIVKDSEYDNRAYLYHLGRIEADYADETIEYLKEYRAYLEETDGYRAGVEKDFAEGKLTRDEYDLAISELEADKQTLHGFKILESQGDYLKRQSDTGIGNLGFVDKQWADRVLGSKLYMVAVELLLACTMFAVFGGYLTSDHNVFGLIKSTYRGRWENQLMKPVNLIIYSLVIAVPPLAAYYVRTLGGYEPVMFDYGLRSIDMYGMCGMDVTVKEMLVVSAVFKYAGVVCMGLFMYFLTLWHLPKPVFQIIVLLATVMLPAIEVMGAPMDFIGFGGFFYAEQLFKRGMTAVIIYPVAVCMALAVFGVLSVRRYRGKQWIRRSYNGRRS